MRIDWRIAVALLVLAGCPSEAPREVPDAAVAAAVLDAGVEDAGPPAPLVLAFVVTARLDGGEQVLGFVDSATEVDPVTGFTLSTPVRLKDYRIRLLDWADLVVSSDDSAELTDGGLVYRMELPQPLKAGRRYSLVVDAQFAPEIDDEVGRHYDDVRLGLKVRGELQPDTPARKKKPGKKKKR